MYVWLGLRSNWPAHTGEDVLFYSQAPEIRTLHKRSFENKAFYFLWKSPMMDTFWPVLQMNWVGVGAHLSVLLFSLSLVNSFPLSFSVSQPVVRLIEEACDRGLKEVRFITLQNQYILNILEGFQQNAVFGFRRQIKKRPLFRSSIMLTPYLQWVSFFTFSTHCVLKLLLDTTDFTLNIP